MNKVIEKNKFKCTGIGLLLLCFCAPLFLFCCLTAIGDELTDDELDPTSLLADDSAQNDNVSIVSDSSNRFDIQLLPKTDLADFNSNLPATAPATNFVAEVKNELKTEDKKQKADNQSSVLRHPSPVLRPPPALRSSLSEAGSSEAQDDLKQIIEQIRSLNPGQEKPARTTAKSPDKISESNITIENAPKDPNFALRVNPQNKPADLQTASAEKSDSLLLSSQVLQQVDILLKEPNNISNPLELAEILFKSGKTSQAAVCYKQALFSTPADDANLADERAWILFQIGNCLKFDDPNTARESFSQLLKTHPESPWAQAAKSSRDLADWLQQEQPQKLIKELKK